MTSYVWKGTSATDHSGAWGVPADWTASGVPAAGDAAVINATGSYTVTTNTTDVTGVGTLVLNAAGATLQVASTIDIGTSLDAQAGTISMLANTALISSAGTGTITIGAGATLVQTVPDTSVTGPSVAYIGTPFTNNGTVLLVNTGGLFLADPASPYQLSAKATNDGTILVSNSNLIVRSATLDGTGIIVLSNKLCGGLRGNRSIRRRTGDDPVRGRADQRAGIRHARHDRACHRWVPVRRHH